MDGQPGMDRQLSPSLSSIGRAVMSKPGMGTCLVDLRCFIIYNKQRLSQKSVWGGGPGYKGHSYHYGQFIRIFHFHFADRRRTF